MESKSCRLRTQPDNLLVHRKMNVVRLHCSPPPSSGPKPEFWSAIAICWFCCIIVELARRGIFITSY